MSYIHLNIDLSRTSQVAGSLAVTEMRLGNSSQPILPKGCRRLAPGLNVHAVKGQRRTGTEQSIGVQAGFQPMPGIIGDFNHTDLALFVGGFTFDVAQRRYGNTGASGDLEYGQAFFGNYLIAVYVERNC